MIKPNIKILHATRVDATGEARQLNRYFQTIHSNKKMHVIRTTSGYELKMNG